MRRTDSTPPRSSSPQLSTARSAVPQADSSFWLRKSVRLTASSLQQLSQEGWKVTLPEDERSKAVLQLQLQEGASSTERKGLDTGFSRVRTLGSRLWPEVENSPMVGFFGLSDSGKTHLLTRLVGHPRGQRHSPSEGLCFVQPTLMHLGEATQAALARDLLLLDTEGPNRRGQAPDAVRRTVSAALQELAFHLSDAVVMVVKHSVLPTHSRTTSWPEQTYAESLMHKALLHNDGKLLFVVHNFRDVRAATSEEMDCIRVLLPIYISPLQTPDPPCRCLSTRLPWRSKSAY